jgi:SNF2 family DNA or RNA helicase
MLAELDGSTLHFSNVEHRDRDGVREVPGVKFVDNQWQVPVSWPTLVVLRSIFGDRLEVGPNLSDWAWTEYNSRVRPTQESRLAALDPAAESSLEFYDEFAKLYPFQQTGIEFMLVSRGCILADEMGTGKTAQAIAVIDKLDSKLPVLVIAPKSAKAGWVREFGKWCPALKVISVGGSAARRRTALAEEADVYVVHWDALRLHSRLARYGSTRLLPGEAVPKDLNRPWGAVIADEAHRALNPKAKQTRALWAVGASAEVRYALTGTPGITPDQLWSLLRFVAPDEWPSKTQFMERYCHTMINPFGGMEVLGLNPEHASEFHDLLHLRMLRRPKKLVLPWLPPKVYERRDVEMSPKQEKAYNQFKKGMMAELDGGVGKAFDPLSVLGRLTQLAGSCAEIDENGKIRLCVPSTKVDALVELLEDLGPAEPLVVFAFSSQLIHLAAERLEKEKISHALIIGGMSEITRWTAEQDFQEGRVRVLLMTFGAGSESLTLTRAHYICFLQRSWKYEHNVQAEDRIHREGQTADQVTYIDLVAPGTVEENMQDTLDENEETFQEIVQDREVLRRWLSD